MNRELGYTEGLSNTLNNIGILYDEQGNFDKALEYYTRSLQLDKENNNKDGIASSLNNIGLYYVSQKIYDKALAQLIMMLAYLIPTKILAEFT
ncbi:MAG TPA: tetratricopeptide repeat protein [Phycisphaerales bacterium]|nr:tetratricopeptide repeat protein [Phycisphaerales bacterium]